MEEKIEIYESLLNEKSSLEKECKFLYEDYIREFGEENKHLFELKIESISNKKRITFCNKKQNKGEDIYEDELENYIDKQMADYYIELDRMIAEKEIVDENKGTEISFDSVGKIKKLYYRIVHLIHPDLHPEYQNEVIQELWQQAVDAYERNDYNALVETYDRIAFIIKVDEVTICLDGLDAKIEKVQKEINEIKENEPYKFKFLLNDVFEKDGKHAQLLEEIKSYKDYIESLKKELSKFKIIKRSRGDA